VFGYAILDVSYAFSSLLFLNLAIVGMKLKFFTCICLKSICTNQNDPRTDLIKADQNRNTKKKFSAPLKKNEQIGIKISIFKRFCQNIQLFC
jgi:hypothetical protein